MAKNEHVSLSVIRRLPRYYRFLADLLRAGTVSYTHLRQAIWMLRFLYVRIRCLREMDTMYGVRFLWPLRRQYLAVNWPFRRSTEKWSTMCRRELNLEQHSAWEEKEFPMSMDVAREINMSVWMWKSHEICPPSKRKHWRNLILLLPTIWIMKRERTSSISSRILWVDEKNGKKTSFENFSKEVFFFLLHKEPRKRYILSVTFFLRIF